MKKISLKVNGMVCNGCENRVINALKDIDGIESVSANHNSGTVIVTLKEETEDRIIEETIENLGFEIIKED